MRRFQFRCKTSAVVRVNEMLEAHPARQIYLDALATTGFRGLTELRLTNLMTDVVEIVMKGYDAKEQAFLLGNDRSFKISEKDVHRVYGIPRGGNPIVHPTGTKTEKTEATAIAESLGLQPSSKNYVVVDDIEDRLLEYRGDSRSFARLYVLLAISTMLAPRNSMKINMAQYGKYVKDIDTVASYNWAGHIREFLLEGGCCISLKRQEEHRKMARREHAPVAGIFFS